jgi:hypothetical protein
MANGKERIMKVHWLRPAGWHGLKQRYTLCGLDNMCAITTRDPEAVTCKRCRRISESEGRHEVRTT